MELQVVLVVHQSPQLLLIKEGNQFMMFPTATSADALKSEV
jgi:hypothetical protein